MIDKETKRFGPIFDALTDGLYIVDESLSVEYMNDTLIKEFGQGRGKKCYEVLHKRLEVCPWCRAKEVFSGETARWEHYDSTEDRTYELTEFPLVNSDGTTSKVSILRDITQRKKAEDELRISEADYKRLFAMWVWGST